VQAKEAFFCFKPLRYCFSQKIAPSEAVQAANGIADQEPQAHGVLYMKKPRLIV
jgi:hypothetical protein